MPPTDSEFRDSRDLQRLMLEDAGIEQFLQGLATLSGTLLGDQDNVPACVVIERARQARVRVSSTPALDALVELLGKTEFFSARLDNDAQGVKVFAITADAESPEYDRAVADLGFSAIMRVPLDVGEEGTGCIFFYSRDAALLGGFARRAATVFAVQASVALQMKMRGSRQENTAGNLRSAMDSRTVIDLAVGIIMSQNRCSQDEAFTFLQSASNSRNIKVRILAETMVAAITSIPATTHYAG
ncbi:hypothetical protein IWX65_002913 [Arthrobacter sp. CAN_A214]|uniref:ANTAR domain-containing protein n=1 Tax=Arthrobacter sp. CAN_A214 TaxID=2787720 RepID=UPI0018CB6B9E